MAKEIKLPELSSETWPEARRFKAGTSFNWLYPHGYLQWLRMNKGDAEAREIAKIAWDECIDDYLFREQELSYRESRTEMPWAYYEGICVEMTKRYGPEAIYKCTYDVFAAMASAHFMVGAKSFGLLEEPPSVLVPLHFHYFANCYCGGMPGEVIIDQDGKRCYARYKAWDNNRCYASPRGLGIREVCDGMEGYYQTVAKLYSAKSGMKLHGGMIEPRMYPMEGGPYCRWGYWEVDEETFKKGQKYNWRAEKSLGRGQALVDGWAKKQAKK